MVQTKVRSIDGDGHVIEDIAKLVEHMEAPYRSWYGQGRGGVIALTPGDGAPRGLGGKFDSGSGNNTDSWLTMMQEGDLDAAILYPTAGLAGGFLRDRDYAVAFCRAYNNWMAKPCSNLQRACMAWPCFPFRMQRRRPKSCAVPNKTLG